MNLWIEILFCVLAMLVAEAAARPSPRLARQTLGYYGVAIVTFAALSAAWMSLRIGGKL